MAGRPPLCVPFHSAQTPHCCSAIQKWCPSSLVPRPVPAGHNVVLVSRYGAASTIAQTTITPTSVQLHRVAFCFELSRDRLKDRILERLANVLFIRTSFP